MTVKTVKVSNKLIVKPFKVSNKLTAKTLKVSNKLTAKTVKVSMLTFIQRRQLIERLSPAVRRRRKGMTSERARERARARE